jgi:hypothetical protein
VVLGIEEVHPIRGGADRTGWVFGAALSADRVALLASGRLPADRLRS